MRKSGTAAARAWQEETELGNTVWLIIMIPVSLLFTGLGIYAWKRKKPMWFWSGSTVEEEEISDVNAYNRANGILWLVFSALLWISTVLGYRYGEIGGICLLVSCLIAIPLLPLVYGKILKKYKKK